MELYNPLEARLQQHVNTISVNYLGPRYEPYNAQRDTEAIPELNLKGGVFKFLYVGQIRALMSHCKAIGLIPTTDTRQSYDYLKNHTLESLVSALDLASRGYTYTTNHRTGNTPMLVTTRLTFYSIVTYDDFVIKYNQLIPIGKVYTLQGQGFIYRNTTCDVVIIVKDYFDTLKVPFFDTGNLSHRQIDQPERFIPESCRACGMLAIDTESKPYVSDTHLYDVCPIDIVAVGDPEDVPIATDALDKVLSKFPSMAGEIYPTIERLIGEHNVQFVLGEHRDTDMLLEDSHASLFSMYVELHTSVYINNIPRRVPSQMPTITMLGCTYLCRSEADRDKVIRFLLDNEIIESASVLEIATVTELIDALLLRATLVGLKS